MSALIDAMGQDLVGPNVGLPRGDAPIMTNLRRLVNALGGSVSAAARTLGVPRSTLRGWLAGSRPRLGARDVLARVRGALTGRDPRGQYLAAYRGQIKLVIRARVRVSGDVRVRLLRVGDHISIRKMQGVLRAWAAGDDNRTERLLLGAINTDYARGLTLEAIEGAWFE